MDRFERLLKSIAEYDNDADAVKATAHHSAVSVRVDEMKALVNQSDVTD